MGSSILSLVTRRLDGLLAEFNDNEDVSGVLKELGICISKVGVRREALRVSYLVVFLESNFPTSATRSASQADEISSFKNKVRELGQQRLYPSCSVP
jgi:hypothetical protein